MNNHNGLILLLAAEKIGTFALGPGYRAAIWVQGCPFHCQGCISPEWTLPGGYPVQVDQLTDKILANPQIEGITFSGGEPMQQAQPLAELARKIRLKKPELNVICFTGYRYEQLRKGSNDGVQQLLGQVDLLIDGPYIASKNDDMGLRGSSNQRMIHLTNRLLDNELGNSPRKIEVMLNDGDAFIVGVPPKRFALAWQRAMGVAKQEIIR
jgi:anaerobic ribonucleoside-triphosphate reductase activating protein